MKIEDAFKSIVSVGVDTAPFIYYIEKHPTYFELTRAIFEHVSDGTLQVSASVLTLTEVLMKPIQANNTSLQKRYRDMLLNTKHVFSVPVDASVAIKAAELRATHNLKTPDALHVASAIVSGCDAFITNDGGIKRVTEIAVLVLDEMEI